MPSLVVKKWLVVSEDSWAAAERASASPTRRAAVQSRAEANRMREPDRWLAVPVNRGVRVARAKRENATTLLSGPLGAFIIAVAGGFTCCPVIVWCVSVTIEHRGTRECAEVTEKASYSASREAPFLTFSVSSASSLVPL
jgi:hypothetical protein